MKMGISEVQLAQIIPLTASLVNLLLALFVITRSPRAALNQVYGFLGICIAIWNFGTFLLFVVSDYQAAVLWARFLQFGVIFVPVALLHLGLLVSRLPVGRWICVVYAVHIGLAVSNLGPFFLAGVRHVGYAYYSVAGPGFWLYSVSYSILCSTIFVIGLRRIPRLPPFDRVRLKGYLWGCGLLVFFGSNDILPILGVEYYPGTDVQIFPFGSVAAIFYGIIFGYNVLQHQLLDLNVILGHAGAQTIRGVFLFLLSLAFFLMAVSLFPRQFPPAAFISAVGVFLCSALVAAYFFPRIFGAETGKEHRPIFGDRFEYRDKIENFIHSVPSYLDTQQFLTDFDDLMLRTVGVEQYYLLLFDDSAHSLVPYMGHPEPFPEQIPRLRQDAFLFEVLRRRGFDFLALNPTYAIPGEEVDTKRARQDLGALPLEFCFPAFYDDHPVALVLIGRKSSGAGFNAQELHLLAELVKNVSLIFNQIRFKNQMQLAQEMELMGVMSRGMAHDLNNLLTPVSTLLQLLNRGEADDEIKEALLPEAMRNIKTMEAYIGEALFFARHQRLQIKTLAARELMEQAVAQSKQGLERKQVEVAIKVDEEAVLEGDEVLLQRMLANLISNAVDASRPEGRIDLELFPLPKSEQGEAWIRLRVVDHGQGIRHENLAHIYTPYFTTKDRGDKERGFGLGLTICRKIVHLHGGHIVISSQPPKGTTVQVDLPSQSNSNARENAQRVIRHI